MQPLYIVASSNVRGGILRYCCFIQRETMNTYNLILMLSWPVLYSLTLLSAATNHAFYLKIRRAKNIALELLQCKSRMSVFVALGHFHMSANIYLYRNSAKRKGATRKTTGFVKQSISNGWILTH